MGSVACSGEIGLLQPEKVYGGALKPPGFLPPYLIFVIFFTQTRFLENKIYTEERVNYDKRISRQNSVNRDLLDQANNKDQDHEKKGNYTLCVKAVYHWMGVKTTYSVKITHIV